MDRVSDGAKPVLSAGRWRWLGYAALTGVLALAFWGYTTPEMMLSWENLIALCGFG